MESGLLAVRDATRHVGAKIALICGDELVTYLRDDRPHLPDPGLWDFPGGERDNGETASECVLRETEEEFGIRLTTDMLIYAADYASHQPDRDDVAFFVAHIDEATVGRIAFGIEGQYWRLMEIAEFLERSDAVRELQQALSIYLEKVHDQMGSKRPICAFRG